MDEIYDAINNQEQLDDNDQLDIGDIINPGTNPPGGNHGGHNQGGSIISDDNNESDQNDEEEDEYYDWSDGYRFIKMRRH